jgi:hypothetical protein
MRETRLDVYFRKKFFSLNISTQFRFLATFPPATPTLVMGDFNARHQNWDGWNPLAQAVGRQRIPPSTRQRQSIVAVL